MKTTIQLSLIALAAILFSACAPRIAGNWTVQRYEAITLGQQQGSSFNNIGTMSFDKKEREKRHFLFCFRSRSAR